MENKNNLVPVISCGFFMFKGDKTKERIPWKYTDKLGYQSYNHHQGLWFTLTFTSDEVIIL